MKKTLFTLILVLVCIVTFACSSNADVNDPSNTINIGDSTNIEAMNTSNNDIDDFDPMGGDKYCSVHKEGYHSISILLINQLDEQQDFNKWVEESMKLSSAIKSDCPYSQSTIYEFVNYFNISKDTIIDLYNRQKLKSYINIDLLYSGTAEENDKYYRTLNENQSILEEYEKWVKFDEMKHSVMKKSKAEDKSMNWSVVQLAYSAGITDLSKVLPVQDFKESSTEFIYNADALSALPEKSVEEIIEKYTPYYLDCLVCGVTPYNTPYERQVALNAEKE